MIVGLICTVICAGFTAWAIQSPAEQAAPEKKYDYTELSARVRKLAKTQQRLDDLEQMITDVELCDPEKLQKNFQFGWQSGGINKTYDFWTDGENGTTDDMVYLAQRERQRLRTSLLKQIEGLQRVGRYGNVTETIDLSAGEGSGENG